MRIKRIKIIIFRKYIMPKRRSGGPLALEGPKSAMTRKPKARRGLNKIERKEVKAIITTKAESKYFEAAESLQGQALKVQSSTAVNQEIMVRGFAVGSGGVAVSDNIYGYEATGGAGRAITPMFMARTFDVNSTDSDYRSQVPVGKTVTTAMCRTTWRIHRTKVDTSDAEQDKIAAPYIVRFIRVKPRGAKFSDVDLVPRLDLFQNNYGVAYGIDSPENTYQRNFGLFEMMTSKVNSRKYTTVQDIQFQLGSPLTGTQLETDIIATMTSMSSQKILTCNHEQLKKLHYSGSYDNADAQEPLSGQSNEMIFIHVGVLGTTTRSLDLGLKIDVKPIATFKDV